MPEGSGSSLEERISHLEDIEAIRGLIATYAHSIDTLDFDRLESLYSADAHLVIAAFGVDVTSPEAVRATLTGMSEAYRKMRHKIVNLDIDPESRKGRAYFMLTCIDAAQNQAMVGEGGYQYKFAKVDGKWRLSEQIIEIAYLSPASWAVE